MAYSPENLANGRRLKPDKVIKRKNGLEIIKLHVGEPSETRVESIKNEGPHGFVVNSKSGIITLSTSKEGNTWTSTKEDIEAMVFDKTNRVPIKFGEEPMPRPRPSKPNDDKNMEPNNSMIKHIQILGKPENMNILLKQSVSSIIKAKQLSNKGNELLEPKGNQVIFISNPPNLPAALMK